MLQKTVDSINTYIFGPGLCIAVFISGFFFLFYLRPFFITRPRHMLRALKSGGANGISPFRALCVALAGTLGVGNIAGVASAIAIGGAGAVFWMLMSAFAAIPIKYAETVLAMRYRKNDRNGTPHGGAFYYIESRGTKVSKAFAAVFAVICLLASLSMGSAVQSNAIAVTATDAFGVPPIVCGIIIGVLTLTVAAGGLARIAFLTDKLIPIVSGVYILMSLYVISTNAHLLGDITLDIIRSALDVSALEGGIIGFITSKAIRIGVTRGIVSNEAGCGTAPIAHASSNITEPAAQGVFGIFEVFIDTVVICSLTAFTVLIGERCGVTLTQNGMGAASDAFGMFIPFAKPILCVSVAIFAFCTIVCWFYYGAESLCYLTQSRGAKRAYLMIYSFAAVYGAIAADGILWSLSDLFISAMCALNVTVLLFSSRQIKKETADYFYENKL